MVQYPWIVLGKAHKQRKKRCIDRTSKSFEFNWKWKWQQKNVFNFNLISKIADYIRIYNKNKKENRTKTFSHIVWYVLTENKIQVNTCDFL